MIKIAIYGKGGIGKSTTVSNLAVAFAEQGMKVMQIGCDPKADSTISLLHGERVPTVLQTFNEKKQNLKLEDVIKIGYKGVIGRMAKENQRKIPAYVLRQGNLLPQNWKFPSERSAQFYRGRQRIQTVL